MNSVESSHKQAHFLPVFSQILIIFVFLFCHSRSINQSANIPTSGHHIHFPEMAVSRSCWIFAISAGVLAIGLLTFLGVYEKPEKSPVNVNGYYNEYTKFAVVSDDSRCSQIGSDILEKGGSAVDAGIATAVCIGVVNPQASGIGGSMFMTYKNHESGDNFALNARETAPLGSDQNMFESYDESTYGGRSIAIPGQIKGFHASWDKYRVGLLKKS